MGTTGGGKGMQVANYSPDGKCGPSDEHDSLEPVEGVHEQERWGDFLRAIPPPQRFRTMPVQPPIFAMQPKRGCNKMSPLGCKKETVG